MIKPNDIIGFFPAAGAGGSTLDSSREIADQLGCALLELPNPPTIDDLTTGRWYNGLEHIVRAQIAKDGNSRLVLVGHCMGGLSAFTAASLLRSTSPDVRVGALVINTPYPGRDGRIPTMSALSDSAIGELLGAEGFPQELIDDVDMLEEVATNLRAEATVADRVAGAIHERTDCVPLHALSTRGDPFITPGDCEGWSRRSCGLFGWTICEGGHAINEFTAPVLRRTIMSLFGELA